MKQTELSDGGNPLPVSKENAMTVSNSRGWSSKIERAGSSQGICLYII